MSFSDVIHPAQYPPKLGRVYFLKKRDLKYINSSVCFIHLCLCSYFVERILKMDVYICIYMCIYSICMDIYVCIYICIYSICMDIYVDIYMDIYIYIYN